MHGRFGRVAIAVGVVAAVAVSGCGTSTPAPAPAPTPTMPGLLWVGDAETGDLSQFEDTPWNVHGGAPPPEVVTDRSFVRDGRHAIGFTIAGVSNGEGITSDSRTELVPRTVAFHEGDEYWFAFSTYLADGFPVQEGWQVVTQWKNEGTGSPPVELDIGDGGFSLGGGDGHPDDIGVFMEPLGTAETGEWVDWTFRILFSTDPERAEVEVWRDGDLVLPTFRPETGTLYPPVESEDVPDFAQSYLKTGYYRDAEIGTPGTIYYDSWKVGTSADAVRREATS